MPLSPLILETAGTGLRGPNVPGRGTDLLLPLPLTRESRLLPSGDGVHRCAQTFLPKGTVLLRNVGWPPRGTGERPAEARRTALGGAPGRWALRPPASPPGPPVTAKCLHRCALRAVFILKTHTDTSSKQPSHFLLGQRQLGGSAAKLEASEWPLAAVGPRGLQLSSQTHWPLFSGSWGDASHRSPGRPGPSHPGWPGKEAGRQEEGTQPREA